jgi:phage tail-like protein
MSTERLQQYRFEKEKQWDTCLFAQADRATKGEMSVAPFAPYMRPATLFESRGAHAPLVTCAGEILWFDDEQVMHRWSPWGGEHETCHGSAAVACAARVVVAPNGLWIINSGSPARIELYEEETFTRLLSADLSAMQLVDIAGDGNSVLALIKDKDGWQSISLDRAGRSGKAVRLAGVSDALAFVFLRRSQRFVVLTGGPQPKLHWFSAKGGIPIYSLAVKGLRSCFEAQYLAGDSRDRIFLSGREGAGLDGQPYILILDADGNRLDDLPVDQLDSPVTGITADRGSLLVTGPRGLSRFTPAETVPLGVGQTGCAIVTPALFSPDREDGRRWLRAEVNASLPEGSTLEISYATTDKPDVRNRLDEIAKDDSKPGSRRLEELLAQPDVTWSGRTVFHGTGSGEMRKSFAAHLFNATDRYLWVCATLNAGAGGRLPSISRLDVLYPGRSLMEKLPAIYRRQETEPNNFLRSFVGALEMTTQELDNKIGSMGSQIDTNTAEEPWLNFIARWLGVPWSDEFTLEQKRAILSRGPEIANSRGTRTGLEAMLESLVPGTPRRFRVTDATADFGFAIVGKRGGGSSCGSTLPAMLGGNTRWKTELDSSVVLGYTRLGCDGQREDSVWQLTGKVRVEVAATAAERKVWEPWLVGLIGQMISLTARLEFRWVSQESLYADESDGTITLGPEPEIVPHLGTDAITSRARLPRRGTRLSGGGPVVGTRLDG